MPGPARCAAVIPCLDEEAAIGALVRALRPRMPDVIVIDDGSRDQTAACARAAGAQVLHHDRNHGKGAALRTGWNHALALGYEWCLAMDGDGQHSPDDIPAFFECAERSGAPLIIGNRLHALGRCRQSHPELRARGRGNLSPPAPTVADAGSSSAPGESRMPWLRYLANRVMSWCLSRAAGRHFPDSQCGFQLMHLPTWATLSVTARRFEIESDLLLTFAAAGKAIEFVPVQLIYGRERSKIQPVRDTIRWFRWWRTARSVSARSSLSALSFVSK